MKVIIDTSVWVDHFRSNNAEMVELLKQGLGLMHPMVLLELQCGNLPGLREQTLKHLGLLPVCNQARPSEVMTFIENEKLHAMGCGLVDITLLASALLTEKAVLWTLDKRLASLAARFSVAYQPS